METRTCPVCDEPLRVRPKDKGYPDEGHDLVCEENGCYEEILDEAYGNRIRVGKQWFYWGYATSSKRIKPLSVIAREVRYLRDKRALMNPMEQTFKKILKGDPYDRLTRNAYADWLEERGQDDEALSHRRWTPEVQEAEERLRSFSEEVGISYESCVQAGYDYVDRMDFLVQYGREDARNVMNKERSRRWWADWCLVTGEKKPDEPKYGLGSAPFSCSC